MSANTLDISSIQAGAFDAFSSEETRAIESGEGSVAIKGYAARFNELSDDLGGYREFISPGAFDDVLVDPKTDVRALVNHEGVPLARFKGGRDNNTLSLSVDDQGLRYSFDLDLSNAESRALATSMARGDIDQSSFRFRAAEGSKFIEKDGAMVRDVFHLTSLRDVSIVTFPAYPTATAEVVRSLEEAKEASQTSQAELDATKRRAAAAEAQAEADADATNANPLL